MCVFTGGPTGTGTSYPGQPGSPGSRGPQGDRGLTGARGTHKYSYMQSEL